MKMNKILRRTSFLIFGLIGIITASMAQSSVMKQDLSIFPKPEAGYKKMVIEVPYSSSDEQKRIEFKIGKWMDVDGCNSFGLQGTLEKKPLQGWGYDYYVFKTKGDVISTQMACPGLPNRKLFVSAQPEMVRYNGRLPIVIYVPEEYQVQFNIFKAEEDTYLAAEVPAKD